jgi:predicted nucleotidyltransferase component of viral defense system
LADERLKIWETLFQRALQLIDSAKEAGAPLDDWSFGGGTVLMRRHHHRFSKDIDIFVPDRQLLGYLSPRLSTKAESMTNHYDEQGNSVKLYFPEGEIDFVAAGWLTHEPVVNETLFGRNVQVETSTEIVGKKVWYRGEDFKARDIFDLAMVAEKEPKALEAIKPVLGEKRGVILERMKVQEAALREEFSALEVLDYQRTYDECSERVRRVLE